MKWFGDTVFDTKTGAYDNWCGSCQKDLPRHPDNIPKVGEPKGDKK